MSLASDPSKEHHHLILGMIGRNGGQVKRGGERERDKIGSIIFSWNLNPGTV